MQVQYLVGLCCLIADRDAVEVTLGDEVLDEASRGERDVDVTVTVPTPTGTAAFKAYEVKKESKPLHVGEVEALCAKLNDMPDVTHRAIVSASGFTEPAVRKAAHHAVDLYRLEAWSPEKDGDFHDFHLPGDLALKSSFTRLLLHWVGGHYFDHRLQGNVAEFKLFADTPVWDANGNPHRTFSTLGEFWFDLALRSTHLLFAIPPASQRREAAGWIVAGSTSEPWSHSHTLEVGSDHVHLKVSDELHLIERVTISGEMEWRAIRADPEFSIVRRLSDGEIFAGAAAIEGAMPGQMFVFTLARGSHFGLHPVMLTPKQMNLIKNLKVRWNNRIQSQPNNGLQETGGRTSSRGRDRGPPAPKASR